MLKFEIEVREPDDTRVYKLTESGKRILANRFDTLAEARRDYPNAEIVEPRDEGVSER